MALQPYTVTCGQCGITLEVLAGRTPNGDLELHLEGVNITILRNGCAEMAKKPPGTVDVSCNYLTNQVGQMIP